MLVWGSGGGDDGDGDGDGNGVGDLLLITSARCWRARERENE